PPARRAAGLEGAHPALKDAAKARGRRARWPRRIAPAAGHFPELPQGSAICDLLPDRAGARQPPGVGQSPSATPPSRRRPPASAQPARPYPRRRSAATASGWTVGGAHLGALLSVAGRAVIDGFEQKRRVRRSRGWTQWKAWRRAAGCRGAPPTEPPVSKRHQRLASAASPDGDFVTPKSCRTAHRPPDTRQRVSKKKPRIVFSSAESSEEGLSAERTEDETPKTTPIRRAPLRRP
ncbi:condensin complex subunit 1-like, partial [Canis aureus]